MNLSSNRVLVTGGASGIGFALAERFLGAGNQVILVGRRADKLDEARARHPEFVTRVCDVAVESERLALLDWVRAEHPRLNVLVNNAGIQRRLDLTQAESWSETRSEIAVNLEAPIHLAQLFIPFLSKQERPSIINVTSGLSFAPLANVPVYSATKAALHSFTLSLRHQLATTPIEVIEIIPPAVDTDLCAPGLHTFGVNVDVFADSVFERLSWGDREIPYGTSEIGAKAGRGELDTLFERLNPKPGFSV